MVNRWANKHPERLKQIQSRAQQIWPQRPITIERSRPLSRSETGSLQTPQRLLLKAKRGRTVVYNTHNCSKIEVLHSLPVNMLPDVKLCYLDELVDCYKPHIDTALSNKPCSAKQLIDHTIPTRWRSNLPTIDSVSNVFKNQILVPNSNKKWLLLFVFRSWFQFEY